MMPTYQSPAPRIPAALLATALTLREIHGPYYARCFLEECGVDSSVITELLNEGDSVTSWPQYPTAPR